jgi:Rad3-related DNA helicase
MTNPTTTAALTTGLSVDLLGGKFEQLRWHQVKAIERAIEAYDAGKSLVVLQAPPGTGKSLVGVYLAMASRIKYTSLRSLYVASTKQLQEQLANDFPRAALIQGQANYPCLKHRDLTRAECQVRLKLCMTCALDCKDKEPCSCMSHCSYERAIVKCVRSPLVIMNYSLFLTMPHMLGRQYGFMVYDEADLMEESLRKHVSLTISRRMREKVGIPLPEYKTKPESWTKWVKTAIAATHSALSKTAEQMNHCSDAQAVALAPYRNQLSRLLSKLEQLRAHLKEGWVMTSNDDSLTFQPVRVAEFASIYWSIASRALAMSAFLPSKKMFCRELAFPEEDAEFIELGSAFPPENRPVWFWPAADMAYKRKAEEWPKLVKALDRLLARYDNVKALVHTSNYELARFIKANSVHSRRMLSHTGRDRAEVLNRFKRSPEPLVLLSPSMERGVDLLHDTTRLVVLAKLPFPDLSDKQVSARLHGYKDGQEWYDHRTVAGVVQASSRATRATNDWSHIWILDSQFYRLYRDRWSMFPSYWRDALRILEEGPM